MTKILAIVPARGGSKGIPRKNIKLLAGKPLIAWTIAVAQDSNLIDRVIVSTDDLEIASVARECGAEVPFIRPAELAQDTSPTIDAIQHTLDWIEDHDKVLPEWVMLLQPTTPLRTVEDIKTAIEMTHAGAPSVVSVKENVDHPYLTRRLQDDGTLIDFFHIEQKDLRRQSLPPAYTFNGVIYLNTSESIRRHNALVLPETRAYIMPHERSIDIDTMWDFQLVDLILKDKYGV